MRLFGKKNNDLIPPIESTQPDVTKKIVKNLTNEHDSLLRSIDKINKQIIDRQMELNRLAAQVNDLKKELVITQDEILFQSFGLYQPLFVFTDSEQYARRLDAERDLQKNLIKSNRAISGAMEWSVNGNKSEGKKMIADIQKLLLRSFNNECDEVVGKVKFSNMEQSIKRIRNSCDSISKLGRIMNLAISEEYYFSKIRELRIAYEYAQKKQDEKEQLKLLREEERENAIVQREIEAARVKIQKEQKHYENALTQLMQQLDTSDGETKEEIIKRINDVNGTLKEINKNLEDIDYRESNQRAGYVYIISNIGSFGENVFKIGMTRRLNPEERISELSDASVPFNFDTHALIFTDDAPKLESALHKRFENNKLNMVNHRREFFYATIDEIKEVIKNNYTKAVDFIEIPEAEQFRISKKMKEVLNG